MFILIKRLDLTLEQPTLTNTLNEDTIEQRDYYFRALIERIGIARVKKENEQKDKRDENNAIVERSRVRILLPPHYINNKIHT